MSIYSDNITSVLHKRLIPKMLFVAGEIAKLEPYSYFGRELESAKRQLDYYSMLYDFLYEYVQGDEQTDNDKLTNVVRLLDAPTREHDFNYSYIVPVIPPTIPPGYKLFINGTEYVPGTVIPPATTISMEIVYTPGIEIFGIKQLDVTFGAVSQSSNGFTITFPSVYLPIALDGTQLVVEAQAYENGNPLDSGAVFLVIIGTGSLNALRDLDDNIYSTVVIGDQEWIVEPLKVTQYADNSPIPNITDNNDWVHGINTTRDSYGALYNWYAATHKHISNVINYGYLYNGYTANDVRNIANVGWHIPTRTEGITLSTFLGGTSIAGGKLKEIGTARWNSPNTGADNSSGFNGIGTGWRNASGTFQQFNTNCNLMTSTITGVTFHFVLQLSSTSASFQDNAGIGFKFGLPIRLMKDTTTLTNGQTGTYIGNDGKSYTTICIGTQEWLSENLAETRFRNGDSITNVTDNSAWAAMTTEGYCAYNNDESIALTEVNDLAPAGWHVPSATEWGNLATTIDPTFATGGTKLKEVGTSHWSASGGTDIYGFSARGSGIRTFDGDFADILDGAYFWSSTLVFAGAAYHATIVVNYAYFYGNNTGNTLSHGESIRLVKDFTTLNIGETGTATDYDGNVYQTICMPDGKEWFAENLKVINYNNGIPIPNITDNTAWANDTQGAMCFYNNTVTQRPGAYCWWNNDMSYKNPYGALYNWYVTLENLVYFHRNGTQELGWRVPSVADWNTLKTTLGGNPGAGGKMKEAGTAHWLAPNTGATNSSGFTAIGSSSRQSLGFGVSLKDDAWFLATDNYSDTVYLGGGVLTYYHDDLQGVGSLFPKYYGVSIRCIRDV